MEVCSASLEMILTALTFNICIEIYPTFTFIKWKYDQTQELDCFSKLDYQIVNFTQIRFRKRQL